MGMLSHCSMIIIWHKENIWQGRTTPKITAWPPTTPKTCSGVMLFFLEPRAWTMYFISGFVVQGWWYLYGYAIPLFCECVMMHGQHLIWLGNPRGDSMTSNYTLDMFRGFVAFWNQELEPCIHQWGNSPRSMRNVWICYHTVLYVFYKAWTTFDRGGYPHRS